MSYINELREKRGKAVHDARALLDHAKTEKRDLSEDEQKQYDAYMDDQAKLQTQIEREERQVKLDREAAEEEARKQEGPGKPKDPEKVDIRVALDKALRMGCFSGQTPDEYRLTAPEARALQMDISTSGGYLVPPIEWVNELVKAVDDATFVRSLARVFPVNGTHSMGAPTLENDPADFAWTQEIGALDEDSTMDFGGRELQPHLLTKLLKVSMKLIERSPSAEALVRDRLAYKRAVTLEKAFMTGTGSHQPLGVFTASAAGISTGRDVTTGNTDTAIGADNLREVKYTLKGQYHANARWIFHRDAVKAISKLKDGDGQYLWRPGITDTDPDRLVGFPVLMSEHAPSTFTTGLYVGILGDFSKYWIAESTTMSIQRLVELYAANSQIGFVDRSYTDGMPVLEEAFVRVTLT